MYKVGQTFIDADGQVEIISAVYGPPNNGMFLVRTRKFSDPVSCLVYSLTSDSELLISVHTYHYHKWMTHVKTMQEI